ncbi:aminopeptidase PepB [Aliiglaciecola litoralis]|uniref:Aminopeptidase PepB n=1 Tax=Aliiglaciecola litoralis TaxID=582857 RepID=A0ABN1LEZ1_9ALTE
MSHMLVELSIQPAASHWGKKAGLSFQGNTAIIHLSADAEEPAQLTQIQKAARKLDGMNLDGVKLQGDWSAEQQWAFAFSYRRPRNPSSIEWLDNADKSTLQKRYDALCFTRDLVNATPEDLSPEKLAERSLTWLAELANGKITSKQWVGEELAEAGWIGIYNVGRGSVRPPVLLEVDYNPTGDPNAPVFAALVGKGITFDSGGYSIKSSEGMLSMKCDMGGAATVVGGFGLAIMNGLNKRVKLLLCCAENLISGHAYKLGDVLTYKNGVSVEIVNTDAEGRLVLADGLIAAAETDAQMIIDAATLTGAAVAATGGDYNALFALDKPALKQFIQCAEQEKEPVWALPLEIWHQDKCPSDFADTANSRAQKGGGAGGASNAAGFLSRFVANNGKGWVHIDLAAAYNASGTATMPVGASGIGFRSIARALLED